MTIKILNENGNVEIIKRFIENNHYVEKTIFSLVKPGESVEINIFAEINECSLLTHKMNNNEEEL